MPAEWSVQGRQGYCQQYWQWSNLSLVYSTCIPIRHVMLVGCRGSVFINTCIITYLTLIGCYHLHVCQLIITHLTLVIKICRRLEGNRHSHVYIYVYTVLVTYPRQWEGRYIYTTIARYLPSLFYLQTIFRCNSQDNCKHHLGEQWWQLQVKYWCMLCTPI